MNQDEIQEFQKNLQNSLVMPEDVQDVYDNNIRITEGKSNKEIYELENFVDPAICDEIMNWFKTAPKSQEENAQQLFNGRQINYSKIVDERIKRLVMHFKYEATFLARGIWNEMLYPDFTDLVFWDEGSGMLVHADNADEEGRPNYVSWRNYSGVLYLNDDFLGGETFFPDHGPHFIKPKKGKIALFPAGIEYRHGVSTVVGKRYTLPIWFTNNLMYIET